VVPSIGVNAPVVPVGIQPGRQMMEVPATVSVVGWYRFGPTPGDPGSALLVGHVDDWTQGPGAFFHLQELGSDDVVTVVLAGGSRLSFRVVARRAYPKSQLGPIVFERTGPPMLVLVTCGGPFDRGTRHYLDNVVVFAVPAGR
jgi:hypothetical protein